MKKTIFTFIALLFFCGIAAADRKWPSDYPKFHNKSICPNTEFTGRVLCGEVPQAGIIMTLLELDKNILYETVTNEDGIYSFIVPTGHYAIGIANDFYDDIHAKWKCGVLPFYFGYCQ